MNAPVAVVKADFACGAVHARDGANMAGSIRGEGGGERRGSRAKGRIGYRLLDENAGNPTRVELAMDYQLLGPLVQFGRSGLLRDFTGRMIAALLQLLYASPLPASDRSVPRKGAARCRRRSPPKFLREGPVPPGPHAGCRHRR